MSNAVVVQWARLGDVLQTRVLLKRLRQSGQRVILCADAQFASVVLCFPEIDDFWPMELVPWTAQARHAPSQPALLENMAARLADMATTDVDAVYVLNHSLAAVAFAELLQPRTMHGFTSKANVLQTPPALKWIEHERREGNSVPVHVADIWAELVQQRTQPEWLPALRVQRDKESRSSAVRIGFICDAGDANREIPEFWLADLISACAALGRECVLLGRSKRAVASFGDAKDLRGRTDLASLMSELSSLDVVIGPDTGGLHLAAALGVPVIGLYFGGAVAANTGPYASSAMVVPELAWKSETAREVLRLMDALISKQPIIGSDSLTVLTPRLDEFGLFYEPTQDHAARMTIMNERRSLFDNMKRGSLANANSEPCFT